MIIEFQDDSVLSKLFLISYTVITTFAPFYIKPRNMLHRTRGGPVDGIRLYLLKLLFHQYHKDQGNIKIDPNMF